MTISKPRDDASTWMSGTYTTKKLRLKQAVVKEKLSTLTETTIEFLARKTSVKLDDFVGQIMTVHVQQDSAGDNGRMFTGTCISVEAMGMRDGDDHYVAQIRPWFWMLTIERNTRVFQDMSVKEVIEDVLGKHGFSDFQIKTSETYMKRVYCVQYRETDFAFLSRLMEEEGMYYFFDHSDANMTNEKLIICDGVSAHNSIDDDVELKFKPRDGADTKTQPTINEWAAANSVTRGKVSLADYDFEKPSVRQMETTSMPMGKHQYKEKEYYDLPGHYRGEKQLGDTRTRVRIEADAIQHLMYRGAGDVRHFGTGFLFKLSDHPEEANNTDYLITEAVHTILDSDEMKKGEKEVWLALQPQNIDIDEEIKNDYSFTFGAVAKVKQFRAPFVTPWPEIPGIQIGEVVGPDGKEIHTDEYGRIKVLFRWDRLNPDNDTASCWIRVVTQWSGNNWGLLSIPRIGQEVVVQFEDGDPDRPIVTGMMYNKEKMPPYVDPQKPTRTGLMTRSSPDGGETDYNALVFEDDAGKEYTHFQSQKDYQMVVKDSAQITIGDDGVNVSPDGHTVAAGSLLQTVKQDVTEMVQEGNKLETVDTGTLDLIVEGDMSEVVRTGNKSVDVSSGKSETTVAGNIDVTSGASITATAMQSITLEANQSITLKVPGSSIEIGPSGITIKTGGMMKVEGTMTEVKGSALAILKAPLVNIN